MRVGAVGIGSRRAVIAFLKICQGTEFQSDGVRCPGGSEKRYMPSAWVLRKSRSRPGSESLLLNFRDLPSDFPELRKSKKQLSKIGNGLVDGRHRGGSNLLLL